MAIVKRIKTAAVVLLLLSIFLPISSCTKSYDAEGNYAEVTQQPVASVATEYYYIWEKLETLESATLLYLLCMAWPFAGVVAGSRVRASWLRNTRLVLEPMLAGGSLLFVFYYLNVLTSPSYGSYLMGLAYTLYLSGWLLEVRELWQQTRRRRVPPPP